MARPLTPMVRAAKQSRYFAVNTSEFQLALVDAIYDLEEQSNQIVYNLVRRIVARMRQLVPVLTGDLRDSLGWRLEDDEAVGLSRWVFGSIDPGLNYAWYVEFGTSHNAPYPFTRPAIAEALAMNPKFLKIGPASSMKGRIGAGAPGADELYDYMAVELTV